TPLSNLRRPTSSRICLPAEGDAPPLGEARVGPRIVGQHERRAEFRRSVPCSPLLGCWLDSVVLFRRREVFGGSARISSMRCRSQYPPRTGRRNSPRPPP